MARPAHRRSPLQPASRSISTSTPCPTSASIHWSNPTIYPSEVAASPAFSPSWPRTPTARCSAIRTPISARARRPRRSFASSTSGSASTASPPQHLVFDSKLTTYDRLDRLDAAGITFITLRRRSPSLLAEIDRLPPSAWRTVTLDISSRKHRTPRVYEQKARPHKRAFRQFFITDLGHDEPTILLTNDAKSTAKTIIARYAKRMLIENALSDAVRFFHIDALSSSVGFKVDFDMALLVLASGLYRLMARRMRGYDDAQARQIFRDLIDMPADVAITENEIRVRFHRRAHLPIVLASGLIDKPLAVPWWNGRRLRLVQ